RGQHRLDPSGQPRRMAGIVQDITERKQAETALLGLAEEKYQTLVENINDVLIALDIHGNMTYVSPVVERLSKYKVSDLIGKPFTQLIYPDDLPALSDRFTRLLSGELEPWEFRVVDKDGRLIFVRTSSRPVYKYGEVVGITTLMTDITERRKTEEALHESESLLKATGQMAKVGGWEVDAKTLEVSWTEETYIIHELPLGYKPPLEEAINYFHPEERQKLSDSIQRSLKSGEAWDMEMRFITANGKHLWTRAICSPQVVDGKTMKLRGTFQDITDRKLAEEKLTKSYESLQKTLHDAINTMVKIVEMRDPYTAGHQNKVADLAVAIAREMKLDDTRVDQLRMSAVIHDVGKMYVPSDILAKPGKLANIELDLIKTHSQGGYDIVKSMDLPCSVANTVLQHHERLDGSGYPNQLKGEDTLLEAKILAVADVIEAMSSHRPYRPALGLDKALEEISKNKGKLYDPGVVDTCLGLFNAICLRSLDAIARC
ncbi:MAG: PAS domain S-box protein, partial [Chloroflexi bacterium]|nr:PAS domain S-box protein [Chloroflexota bacterium]